MTDPAYRSLAEFDLEDVQAAVAKWREILECGQVEATPADARFAGWLADVGAALAGERDSGRHHESPGC